MKLRCCSYWSPLLLESNAHHDATCFPGRNRGRALICELPRFSPERFLEVIWGKRLAFIGDSLARNQMDSLLCVLSQVETPREAHTGAFDKFGTWHFPAHDFTLSVMWTEFYAHVVPVAGADGKPTGSFDIHLDRLGAEWTSRLLGLDYAVISGGNWFFRVNYLWEGRRRIGCVNCGRDANLTDVGVPYAVRRVVRAAVKGIANCGECKSSLVMFLRRCWCVYATRAGW